MIDKLIAWSIRWRLFVILLALGLVGVGIYSAIGLPIDAVPDVTTNQVQINSVAPAFTPLEMEQYVTSPIEVAMSSLPRKEEIRSLSQFGLSQVTITFPDDADLYAARQLVLERLRDVEHDLPPGVEPELAPISTGLGEIYQFTVEDVSGKNRYSLMDRRTLLDWFIKPQLRTVSGVIEVNIHPAASWDELSANITALYDLARQSRLIRSSHRRSRRWRLVRVRPGQA